MLFRRRRKNGATAFFNVEPTTNLSPTGILYVYSCYHRRRHCCCCFRMVLFYSGNFTRQTYIHMQRRRESCGLGLERKKYIQQNNGRQCNKVTCIEVKYCGRSVGNFSWLCFFCYLRIGLRFTTQMYWTNACACFFAFFGFVAKRMLKMFAQEF